jgi:hypothetical protein
MAKWPQGRPLWRAIALHILLFGRPLVNRARHIAAFHAALPDCGRAFCFFFLSKKSPQLI